MGRAVGLARGWADRVRNKHDGKTYSVSTLKNDFWDLDFDLYETVVWQSKGPLDEPNEDNTLMVVNTGQKIPWLFGWLKWMERDLAATRHKEIVKVVEVEPPKNWVKKYVSMSLTEAHQLLQATLAQGEGPHLFPVTMCYSLGPRGGHYRGAVHMWPWDSSCGHFPWTVDASMTWLQVITLGVLLVLLVRWKVEP